MQFSVQIYSEMEVFSPVLLFGYEPRGVWNSGQFENPLLLKLNKAKQWPFLRLPSTHRPVVWWKFVQSHDK